AHRPRLLAGGPAPQPDGGPGPAATGRRRRRPRWDHQGEPGGGMGRRRRPYPPRRARHPPAPAVRGGLHQHRLRPVHPRGRPRRGRTRRSLVVGAGHRQGVWYPRPSGAHHRRRRRLTHSILSPPGGLMADHGVTVWFTGLSGAGKSTITTALAEELRSRGRPVEVLDGDAVRENLSKGLGFSREDRDTNIRRIGFVAELLTRHGVTVLVAAI